MSREFWARAFPNKRGATQIKEFNEVQDWSNPPDQGSRFKVVVGLSPRARHGVACVARRAGTAVEVACRLRPAGSEVLQSGRTAPGARHCPEFGARAAIHRRLALRAVALGGRRELGCRPVRASCCSRPSSTSSGACLATAETSINVILGERHPLPAAGSRHVLALPQTARLAALYDAQHIPNRSAPP